MGTTNGGSGSDGESVDGSTTPSPTTVEDESTPRGGSFTAAPEATLTPAGATPAPSMEAGVIMSCKDVFVMIEDAEEFDGVYVMVRKL